MQEQINIHLREHEISVEEWELNSLVKELYRFFGLFNERFFNSALPVPAIEIANTRYDRLGHYVSGRNGFGLVHEININRQHLDRHMVRHLVTLLHEMLHEYQNTHGGCTGYHNKAFQRMSKGFGIPSDRRGVTIDVTEPFISFVREHFGEFDLEEVRKELLIPVGGKGKGKSTLKKYSCGCQNVRVGTSDFQALCLKCGREFVAL